MVGGCHGAGGGEGRRVRGVRMFVKLGAEGALHELIVWTL
jgi:hypothetical protein